MRKLLLVVVACLVAAGLGFAQEHHGEQDSHHQDDGSGHYGTETAAEISEEFKESVHEAEEHYEEIAGEHAPSGHGDEEGGDVMGYLAHHLLDSDVYEIFGYAIHLPVIPGDFSFLGPQYAHGLQVTKHMVGLTLAGLLVILLVVPTSRRTRKGEIPKGFGSFIEVLVIFIRDEVVYANMGREHGRKWLPFFLTLFFLILFANLLGMVPWGTTATGNVNVTGGLAVAGLLGVIWAGIREHGIKYIATFIPHGVPWFVVWLLFPIEIFGLLVKHFALTIRLFANMLAGHTIIGVFIALILVPAVAFAAVPGAVAISMLELFVAFLQAYVFVMLSSLFVGSAIHPH